MKKLHSFLGINSNNKYVKELYRLKKIWETIVPEYIAKKSTIYNFDEEKKELYIRVYDNIYLDSLSRSENILLDKLRENNVLYNKLKFKYDVLYDKIEIKPKVIEYKITPLCEKYIESKLEKINNEEIKEGYRKILVSFFKKNNYMDWITKF